MSRSVALVRNDVSEELSASIIGVTRIGELGTTLAVTSNRSTIMKEALSSSEMWVLTRAIRRNIPEDTFLQHTLWFWNRGRWVGLKSNNSREPRALGNFIHTRLIPVIITYLGIDRDVFSSVCGPLARHGRPMHGVAAGNLGGGGVTGHGSRLREAGAVAVEQSGVRQTVHIRHLAVYSCRTRSFLCQRLFRRQTLLSFRCAPLKQSASLTWIWRCQWIYFQREVRMKPWVLFSHVSTACCLMRQKVKRALLI
jgi:hypothetical protein